MTVKRSLEATYSLLAVSALLRETALNTEQTLSQSFVIDKGTIISPDFRNETNMNEATGYKGPTRVDKRGKTASLSLAFDKLKPHEVAFLLGYGLGNVVTAAGGSTGYKHTITPLATWLEGNRSIPTFSAAQRYAKMEKKRFASGAIKSGKITCGKDDWLKGSADVQFSGKETSNIKKITISAAGNAVSLTLTADAVEGSTAGERLANVDYVRAEVAAGQWVDVVVSAVSSATPAVLTIAAPLVPATAINYEIVYIADEAAWCTFPAIVEESSLYITDLAVIIGGLYDTGTGLVVGGRAASGDLRSIEYAWSLENGAFDFLPGSTGDYANSFRHTGLQQTLSLNRDFTDYLLSQLEIDSTEFAVQIKATGAEYESGHNFEFGLCFPRCMVLNPKRSVDGGLMSEQAEIAVLEGDASGSVIAWVKNQVATVGA